MKGKLLNWSLGLGHWSFSLHNEGMTERNSERRPFPLTPAILTALAVLILAYVGGYFLLGTRGTVRESQNVVVGVVRLYPHKWQVAVFQPAACVESLCLGVEVALGDFGTYGDPNEVPDE